jgi:thioredoxin-related protein
MHDAIRHRSLPGALALGAALVAALLVPAGAAGEQAPAERTAAVYWYTYDEGLARAQQTGRMLLIDFWADWCGWCRKMKAETFTDPAVAAIMNRDFVTVSVNTTKEKGRADEYGVRSLPVIWFVEKDGRTRVTNLPGYVDAPTFLRILRFMGSRAFEKMSFRAWAAADSARTAGK